jgi:D-alanyl-D-alanine carboxypeptidase/D-alanyl-D-alanine-endopeptidase (penicillin-binding protein 4)
MVHRLRIFPVAVLLSALTCTSLPAATASPRHAGTTYQRLAAQLAKTLRHHGAKHLRYNVVDSGYGTFAHNASTPSAPASNQKLFTAITLLEQVGPNFRYATRVSSTQRKHNGVVRGDLVIRGSGDPTITRGTLLEMAKTLHQRGLRRVTGHLVVDDTRYSHKTRVSGWKHSFVPNQSGPVDAFTVDHNAWKHNSTFIANPTHANGKAFRHYLRQRHIKIGRRIEVRRSPRVREKLLTHKSVTLTAIVDATLTDSINFDAEMMFREAGAQYAGHGSPKTGAQAEHALAAKLHLPLGTVHDGSGLSYTERESPSTMTSWLLTLRRLPIYSTVYYALPLSCRTGTLKYRLCGKHVAGVVRAKTGTLTHVSTLSGYIPAESGNAVEFSFFASGVKNFGKLYSKVDAAIALLRRKG